MSVNGPGQFDTYTPPPSPGKRASPWLYVSLGCGMLVLLSFGGCVVGGLMLKNKISADMGKPFDAKAIQQGLGDVPMYPGAKLDLNPPPEARMVESAMRIALPSVSFTMGVYSTPDPVDKVDTFYSDALTKAGYQEHASQQPNQHQYQKGDDSIIIQTPAQRTAGKLTQFYLIRVHGAKKS